MAFDSRPHYSCSGWLKAIWWIGRDKFPNYANGVATHGVPPKGDKKPDRFNQSPYSAIGDNAETAAISLSGDLVRDRLTTFANLGAEYFGPLTEANVQR